MKHLDCGYCAWCKTFQSSLGYTSARDFSNMVTLISPPPVCKDTGRGLYGGVLLSLLHYCVFVHTRCVPAILITHSVNG
jgi:hypothetical protein